jgi:hypothetical protein
VDGRDQNEVCGRQAAARGAVGQDRAIAPPVASRSDPRGATGFAIGPLFGSSVGPRRGSLLSSRGKQFPAVQSVAAGPLVGSQFPETALLARPIAVRMSPERARRCGNEVGQQPAGAPGNTGLFIIAGAARPRTASRGGSLLDHPAGKQRQRRLLRHLLQQDGKLTAEIRHMFQFGHLKVAQRRARTFPKIVHRRFPKPGHGLSPGAVTELPVAARLARVTNFQISTSNIGAGTIPGGLGIKNGTECTPPAGVVSSGYVQRLLR